MRSAVHLYVDDSGSRHPDHRGGGTRWFGLGGVSVREKDEAEVRARLDDFRSQWSSKIGNNPLHSIAIRQKRGAFAWLGDPANAEEAHAFYEGLMRLTTEAPFVCHGCVIDRDGYMRRYMPTYDKSRRWSLCKTAFSILMERSAKYALRIGATRLRVYVEEGDKSTDSMVRGYFQDLRDNGMPFSQTNMSKYSPLDAATLRPLLHELRFKRKSSPMVQLADLCLYPICNAGYDTRGRDYQALANAGKLVGAGLEGEVLAAESIKYSCFEHVVPCTA